MLQILLTLIIGGLVYGVASFLYWYFTVARRIIQMTDHLQAPARHFLFGSLHLHPGMKEERLKWFKELNEEFGDVFKFWLGPFDPLVVVCHPEVAKDILRTAEPKDHAIINYGLLKQWFGNGLLVSNGELWQRNRHLLTPAFHFSMLKKYVDVMNKTTDELIRILEYHSESGHSFDIFQPAGLFALDTVLKCVFSLQENIQGESKTHRIVDIIHEGVELFFHRSLRPYLWPNGIYKLAPSGRKFHRIVAEYSRITQNILQTRKAELKQSGGQYEVRDFMDIMLMARDENGNGMCDEEIVSEVKTFLAAGHDTTTSALCWTLYTLAKYPEHQDLCRKEVREIVEGRTTDDVTQNDLNRLEYLTMVLKETMRLYTTIPAISRKLSQDVQLGEHVLPKGCGVMIDIHRIHHHPEVWDDPDTFMPNRFRPENISGHGPYDFVPFSAGPRNCIGQHFAMNMIKIALARIIHRFEIGHDEKKSLLLQPGIVLKAENGLWLKLSPIQTQQFK